MQFVLSQNLIVFFLPFPRCLLILGRIDGVFARRNLSALFPIEKPTHTTAMKDEYCSLVRATLPVLFVTAGLVLNTTAIAQAPPGSLWYNGDLNDVNGLNNERNTGVTQAAVYDDFDVTAPWGGA